MTSVCVGRPVSVGPGEVVTDVSVGPMEVASVNGPKTSPDGAASPVLTSLEGAVGSWGDAVVPSPQDAAVKHMKVARRRSFKAGS